MAKMLDGNWASTDAFHVAICDNTVAPTAATVTPVIGDFTQVGSAGSYVADGTSLGTLADLVTVAGTTMTFDSATNPTWAQNALNDTDAYWGIIYNYTDAGKDAVAYVDLGGPVDMTAGDLTVTWAGTGIFTITKA
ncbi:MAG: hypothetical protein NUW09_01940 [Deltaproteobacteria bacterium]|nr:hypothetical protein [Deltaproteobacteria bacterium]